MRTLIRQLTVCLFLIQLTAAFCYSAEVLDDESLRRIDGGGIEQGIEGSGLGHTARWPNVRPDIIPSVEPGSNYGLERQPITFVILQSRGVIDRSRVLQLAGNAQAGLAALTLENSYVSDVVSATNIIETTMVTPIRTMPRLNFIQGSEIYQLYRQQGRISSSQAGHRYETNFYSRLETGFADSYLSSSLEKINRTETRQQMVNAWDVEVAKVSPVDLASSVIDRLPRIDPPPVRIIPGFNLGGTVTVAGDKYGAVVKYNGVHFYGVEAHIDGLVERQDDLLLKATMKLPELDFGRVTGCLGKCNPDDYITLLDYPSIGGNNILGIIGDIDDLLAPNDAIAFSDEGIILKGVGGLLEDDLNLNTGFVLSGKGSMELVDPLSFVIGGEISFNADLGVSLMIDPKPLNDIIEAVTWGLAKDVIPKWTFDEEYSLIDVTVPFTLVEIELSPFRLEYNGLVLAQIGPGNVSIDGLEYRAREYSYADNSRYAEAQSREVGSSSFVETTEHSVLVGGELTAGEAELLAMSDGSLSVEGTSLVRLNESSQRGMSVLHGVNAVSSLAANGVNIGITPGVSRSSSQMRLNQSNLFVQER